MATRRSSLSQQARDAELNATEFAAEAGRIAADRQARLESAPVQKLAHSSSKLERLRALKQRHSRSSFGEARGAIQTVPAAAPPPASQAPAADQIAASSSSSARVYTHAAAAPMQAGDGDDTALPKHSYAEADRAALLQRALRAEEDNARLRQLLSASSTNAAATAIWSFDV